MLEFVNIIGIIFSIISIPLGIYFFLKRHTKKQLDIVWNHNVLQPRYHDNVKLLYNGTEIHSLAQLSILVVNIKQHELRKADVPVNGKLGISLSSSKNILSTSIVNSSNPAIDFQLSVNSDNEVIYEFEYLNQNDGAIFEILYDYKENENEKKTQNRYFEAFGEIIGADEVRTTYYHTFGMNKDSWEEIRSLLLVVGIFSALDIWFIYMAKYWWCILFTYILISASLDLYRNLKEKLGKKLPEFAEQYFGSRKDT